MSIQTTHQPTNYFFQYCPNEIVKYILSFLPIGEALKAKLVCKLFNKLITSSAISKPSCDHLKSISLQVKTANVSAKQVLKQNSSLLGSLSKKIKMYNDFRAEADLEKVGSHALLKTYQDLNWEGDAKVASLPRLTGISDVVRVRDGLPPHHPDMLILRAQPDSTQFGIDAKGVLFLFAKVAIKTNNYICYLLHKSETYFQLSGNVDTFSFVKYMIKRSLDHAGMSCHSMGINMGINNDNIQAIIKISNTVLKETLPNTPDNERVLIAALTDKWFQPSH